MAKIKKTIIGGYEFFSFDDILKRDLKNRKFREQYFEELSRLYLAHEVRFLRKSHKMTQEQVAKKADMPQSVIARIESGSHSFSTSTLFRIAQVFNRQISLTTNSKKHTPK